MPFKRNAFAFCLLFSMLASLRLAQAQVAPAGYAWASTLDAGGFASIFDPDYVPNKLVGGGAYVDLNLFHGIGIEAEGRWLRWHGFEGIRQDNYLIGPRIKFKHFWKAQPYGKVLGGFSTMDFEDRDATGRFAALGMGGGMDISLGHRWSFRAVDFEYQAWPKFLMNSLSPYGVSSGISYRIFSR
jgi:hypothetical protein